MKIFPVLLLSLIVAASSAAGAASTKAARPAQQTVTPILQTITPTPVNTPSKASAHARPHVTLASSAFVARLAAR